MRGGNNASSSLMQYIVNVGGIERGFGLTDEGDLYGGELFG